MTTWRNRTKTSIDDCSAELQTLRADTENRKKVGDNFYKMDEESIITNREELSEDVYAFLAQVQTDEVQKLFEVFV